MTTQHHDFVNNIRWRLGFWSCRHIRAVVTHIKWCLQFITGTHFCVSKHPGVAHSDQTDESPLTINVVDFFILICQDVADKVNRTDPSLCSGFTPSKAKFTCLLFNFFRCSRTLPPSTPTVLTIPVRGGMVVAYGSCGSIGHHHCCQTNGIFTTDPYFHFYLFLVGC